MSALGRFDMYISKVNWEQVICPLNRGCLLFREFVVYSECLSAIEGPTVLSICMKGVCLVISPRNASGSREKNTE